MKPREKKRLVVGGTVVCVTISRCTSCVLGIPEGEEKEEEIIF